MAGTVTSVEPEQRKVALFISVPHLEQLLPTSYSRLRLSAKQARKVLTGIKSLFKVFKMFCHDMAEDLLYKNGWINHQKEN